MRIGLQPEPDISDRATIGWWFITFWAVYVGSGLDPRRKEAMVLEFRYHPVHARTGSY